MSSTTTSRSVGIPKKPSAATRRSNGIVDAMVINSPDLSFFLKLQNLLNYFLDCMNNITSSIEDRVLCTEHLNRCIAIMSEIDRNSAAIDQELRRALNEFIEDARKFQNLLSAFSTPETTGASDQGAAVLLSAKASHLQWLSVCILEDVKKNYHNG